MIHLGTHLCDCSGKLHEMIGRPVIDQLKSALDELFQLDVASLAKCQRFDMNQSVGPCT